MSVEKNVWQPKIRHFVLFVRRRQSRSKSATERSVELDDLKSGSQDLTSSTSNLVYQNVGDIRRTIKGSFSWIKVT